MENRIPCKNENCKGTILPLTAKKTGGLCMPCFQSLKRKEEEEYILKNQKDVNLYEGIDDLVEILKIMYSPKNYNPLIKYIEYPRTQEEIYNSLSNNDIKRLKEYAIQLINANDINTTKKILLRIVCFTNSEINDCLELLINKGHYYPGILFKGASHKIREILINQIEKDKENRNHILLALSWVGDSRVSELFSQWHKDPPSWKNELYIPAEDYSFESGWTLTDGGNRSNMFYTDCYPLVHAATSEAEPLSTIKNHEDKCPFCRSQMTVLFDFDLTNPIFNFLNFKGERLRISTCHICTCYGYIFTKIDFSGYSKWHEANKKPSYLPNIENPEEEALEVTKPLTLSRTKRDPYYASSWVSEVPGSQIGGHPTWIQDAEYPICPKCSKHMKFIGQLDCADFMQYGEGIYYAFICEECRIAATHYQQT